jgi:glycosyltransferase 2 family protein
MTATLAFAYLAVRNVDLTAAWDAFRSSQKWWLAPALLVLALAVVLRAIRWRYLFTQDSRPPLGPVVSAYLVGQFFNNILPLRAGEPARILALSRRTRTSRAETTATILIERAFDVLCLLVLLFVLIPWLPPVSWLHAAAAVAIVVALGLGTLAFALAIYGDAPLRLLLTPLRLIPGITAERVTSLASNLGRGLDCVRGFRGGAIAFFLTTLSWVVMGVSFWLASLAFDLPRSPLLGILVVIATNLAQILPSAPAAVGVFEAATLVAVTAYGGHRPIALSYAVVLHVMNFLPYLVVGPVALRRSPVVGWQAGTAGMRASPD